MSSPIYLDNAATTPIQSSVLERMMPFLRPEGVGNPSSAHQYGRAARDALATAREEIGGALGAEPNHVIFTAGGTEADNLAVIGGALAAREQGRPFRVAVSAIEHPGVLEAANAVREMGGEMVILPVDTNGRLDRDELRTQLDAGLAVVSVMWVNNEIGTIEDVPEVAQLCAERDTRFHTDAVQAVGKIPCSLRDTAIDFLALSGHKIGAPHGVGALIVRDRQAVKSIVHGGGQQFGIRSGTENVAAIVGLGQAVSESISSQASDYDHFRRLRDRLEGGIRTALSGTSIAAEAADRAPHISNVIFQGIDSEAMVMHLDLAGIACSAGSACHTGTVEPSRVLTALGITADQATRSVRFSFYKQNTVDDIDRTLAVLPDVTAKVRELAGALGR